MSLFTAISSCQLRNYISNELTTTVMVTIATIGIIIIVYVNLAFVQLNLHCIGVSTRYCKYWETSNSNNV